MEAILIVLLCFSHAAFKDSIQRNNVLAVTDLVTRQVNEISGIKKETKRLKETLKVLGYGLYRIESSKRQL